MYIHLLIIKSSKYLQKSTKKEPSCFLGSINMLGIIYQERLLESIFPEASKVTVYDFCPDLSFTT